MEDNHSPSLWKAALIIPIQKCNDPTLAWNCCSISVLSPSKILEKYYSVWLSTHIGELWKSTVAFLNVGPLPPTCSTLPTLYTYFFKSSTLSIIRYFCPKSPHSAFPYRLEYDLPFAFLTNHPESLVVGAYLAPFFLLWHPTRLYYEPLLFLLIFNDLLSLFASVSTMPTALS